MKAISVTTSGVSASSVAATNNNTTPVNITVAVRVTGACTYNVEYTLDDVYATSFTPASAVWFNHPTLAAGQTTTKDCQINWPVTGIRINQTAGAGSSAATVLQAGI
jgi:hypothetical protein